MTRRPETLDELRVGDEGISMSLSTYVWAMCVVSALAGAAFAVLVMMLAKGEWVAAVMALLSVAAGVWGGPVVGARAIDQLFRGVSANGRHGLTHDQIARIRAVLDGSEG